jgi:hypothetical protein
MIKKVFFLILFVTSIGFSQTEEVKKSDFDFIPTFRLRAIVPISQGDNFLAKANKESIGFGVSSYFAKYKNAMVGFGYDFISFRTSDSAIAGNINASNLNSIYGSVSYRFILNDQITIEPLFGYGYSFLQFRSGLRGFGKQEGHDYRFAVYTDYKLAKRFGMFLGVGLLNSKLSINTSPEYTNFFDHASTLQISLGIKIN